MLRCKYTDAVNKAALKSVANGPIYDATPPSVVASMEGYAYYNP